MAGDIYYGPAFVDSKLSYEDDEIEIWTSFDPEIFRRVDDKRIKNRLDSYSLRHLDLTFVDTDGSYIGRNLEYALEYFNDIPFERKVIDSKYYFEFRVLDSLFVKEDEDYFSSGQSDFLMRVGSLRELCEDLGILRERRDITGMGVVAIVPDGFGNSYVLDAGS